MPTEEKPKTGKLNGRLWGVRARDWAELQEPMTRRVYDAVFERLNVDAQTNYLDVGCGSGLAAQLAAERGAKVTGIDAAENLLAIAQSRVPAGGTVVIVTWGKPEGMQAATLIGALRPLSRLHLRERLVHLHFRMSTHYGNLRRKPASNLGKSST